MESSGLEFHTTRELIDELMRRKTFLGVVVHSEAERRQRQWSGEKVFQVHLNDNLDAEQACRLLEVVSDYLQRHHG